MTDDTFIQSLNEEEARQLRADFDAAQENIKKQREDKKQAALQAEYKAAMLDPKVRGKGHKLAEIKAKFRARGCNVDSVDFTGLV